MKEIKKIAEDDGSTVLGIDCEMGGSMLLENELNKSPNKQYEVLGMHNSYKNTLKNQNVVGCVKPIPKKSVVSKIHKTESYTSKEEKREHSEVKKPPLFFRILKCPLNYHANFIGTVLFIIGSYFFYHNSLVKIGCGIFASACVLLLYANIVAAISSRKQYIDFFGFMCYNVGSIVFIFASIYAIFSTHISVVISFIVGSLFYLIGAVGFFFSINIRRIKPSQEKLIYVFATNFFGGVLFTVGSVMFIEDSLYDAGVTSYVIGSVFFTTATFCDYIIYLDVSMK